MTGPAPRRPTRVAVALGSNVGNRRAHLQWALSRLRRLLTDVTVSPFEDTAPVGVDEPQRRYLNAVLIGRSALGPETLLRELLALEHQRGRVRTRAKAPRSLDLDLVLYGSVTLAAADLQLPHPRFRERDFVLGPLAILAPRWRDPVTGHTMAALWRARGGGKPRGRGSAGRHARGVATPA